MQHRYFRQSVSLPATVHNELTTLADNLGVSRSEIVRLAVDHYLAFHAGRGANPNRVAELAEFNQLVMDQILRRDFPDLREQVLDAVDKRLGKFHGR